MITGPSFPRGDIPSAPNPLDRSRLGWPLPDGRRMQNPNDYGRGFVSGALTEIQTQTPGGGGRYDFEGIDVSTEMAGAQILVLDGTVFGPNDDVFFSLFGSPIAVADGDEVWLEVDYDEDAQSVLSVEIGHGPTTPDDVVGSILYITILGVDVDSSGLVPLVTVTNSVCGDVYIPFFPHSTAGDGTSDWFWGYDSTTNTWKLYPNTECSGGG